MDLRTAQCMLVAKVLVADGMIGPDERRFLDETMDRLGLDPVQRRAVADLDGWDQAEATVAALPEAEKRAVVDEVMNAAASDGRLSALELAELQRISSALGLG
jgi:tellurite resistance protein